ncbi:hypothetical protein FOXYSP1_05412 [Fusarium oxysporum f. sp. phaseoli]
MSQLLRGLLPGDFKRWLAFDEKALFIHLRCYRSQFFPASLLIYLPASRDTLLKQTICKTALSKGRHRVIKTAIK